MRLLNVDKLLVVELAITLPSLKYLLPSCLFLSIAIECPGLTLENGAVTYATDTMANFVQGTIATHSCDNGFVLNGSVTRTCMDNGMDFVGVWSGSAPTCARKFCYILICD